MNEITGFTIFRSYHEAIKELPKKDRGEILISMLEFVFEDKKPNFNSYKKMAWKLIEPNLIKSKNKGKNAKKTKSNQNQIEIKLKSNKNQIKITHLLILYPYININNILKHYILVKGDYKGEKPFKFYGSQKNVKLTEKELQKLKEKFSDYEERIEDLSLYIASKGKKYKSHYATILTWSRKEKSNKPKTAGERWEETKRNFLKDGEND